MSKIEHYITCSSCPQKIPLTENRDDNKEMTFKIIQDTLNIYVGCPKCNTPNQIGFTRLHRD